MKIFSLFLALLLWSGAAQVPQAPSDREEPAGEVVAVESITTEEAIRCLQVELDTTYKGQFEGFLDFYDNMTQEEAQAQYDANLEGEAQFFFYMIGLEDYESWDTYTLLEPSQEQLARAQELYREVYAQSDYTVLSAAKARDGLFLLEVQIRPLDLYTQMDGKYDDHFAPFWEEIDQMIDLDAMSDEEFLAWYGEAFAPRYYDACLDLLEACTPDLGHLPERTLTVTLRQEADGSLLVDNESWQAIDNQIINYNNIAE